MERPNQSISYVDLHSQGWELTFEATGRKNEYKVVNFYFNGRKQSRADLEDVLEALGLDLSHYEYHVDCKKHRPLTRPMDVVSNYRFVAPERIDEDWLTSGYASDEAKLCTSKMKDMSDVLKQMRSGGERD